MLMFLVIWYVVGLACALFWPLFYWRGMSGSWGEFFKAWPWHGFAGPFAILLAFPL